MSKSQEQHLRLPGFFTDNMVLQRDRPVPVWGWGTSGASVRVELAGGSAEAAVGEDGRWRLWIGPFAAGGPHVLTVRAGAATITLRHVLIGDVWICSGQSNMEFRLADANDAAREVAEASFPLIRHAAIPHVTSATPNDDVAAEWTACTPQTAGAFTAVGYFFGRRLHTEFGVPIGLLHTSWGGSNCETWCSREALAGEASLAHWAVWTDKDDAAVAAARREFAVKLREWEADATYEDPGNTGFDKGWAGPAFDDAGWQTMALPCYWETVPGMQIDGAVWFRKTVDIPKAWAGKPLELSLGAIDDYDTTYFNGVPIGGIGKETPNCWSVPRCYRVPADQVAAGRAVIAVRVFDRFGNGGIAGSGVPLRLGLAGDKEASLVLNGAWRYAVEIAYVPKPMIPAPMAPVLPGEMNAPCALYNAMIAPLIPFAVKGAIWYQGESNADRAFEYRTLFPTMIRDWRRRWGQGDFPFLFVQLANFATREPQPGESGWAELREAQRRTLSEPCTGMAVTIDIGDAVDIHPRNKQDVGLRLALAARRSAYGLEGAYSGPIYASHSVEGPTIRLRFRHVGDGLEAHGGPLTGFAVAGPDRQFVWAAASIEGDTVVVSDKRVKAPVAVRYAWAGNPACNLYNRAGLPASPFRTDDWRGLTWPA